MKIAAKIMSVLSISMFLSNTVAYSQDRTGIVAHRGFWNCEEAGFSENSIAALRCAQEAGFRGSEFDVNMTSDKQLIVFHDNSVEGKRIEDHPFSDFTYYRLPNGEPIPTLDQYLEQGKESAETMLVCELKPHSSSDIENKLVGRTIACIDAHGLLAPKRAYTCAAATRLHHPIPWQRQKSQKGMARRHKRHRLPSLRVKDASSMDQDSP